MTPHGVVTKSTVLDAWKLDRSLRPEDRRELEDVGGKSAYESLLDGVRHSAPAYTLWTPSEGLIGMTGVVPAGGSSGAVWMAGTTLIEGNRMAFLRGSSDVLSRFDETYETLFNVCDARNPVHLRWLEWMGFTLIRRIESFGPNRVPVIEFARINPQCASL